MRDLTDKFLPNGDQSGRSAFDVWSPKVGLLWEVDPHLAGVRQRLPQCRGAELRRELASPSASPSPTSRRRPPPPTRSARAAAVPTTPGTSRSTAWTSSNELQCRSSSFGNCSVVNADKTCTRASRSASAPRVVEVDVRARAQSRPALAQSRLYAQRLPLRRRCRLYGNNLLPGAPRHFLRASCSTSIRAASSSARMSSGCRRPTTWTAPTR